MTLGGGATLTETGDTVPSAIVNEFSRGAVAEITFAPVLAPNAQALIGGAERWLLNTHGADRFSITFQASVPSPMDSRVPEPATLALILVGLAGMMRPRKCYAIARVDRRTRQVRL